jgi:threonine/homoserine/homoserine lactone efflux protein
MVIAFLNGLWQGLLISILLFGPAFFKLMNTSMKEGLFKGWWLATGVLISDLIVVILLIWGLSDIMDNPYFKQYYSLIAGIAMVIMGIKSIRHKYKAFLKSYSERSLGGQSLLSGLALNLINPFTIILWFNVLSAISLKYDTESAFQFMLTANIMGILTTIYLMDIIKVFLANLIGKKLSHKVFFIVNKYFGGIFIIIGVVFLLNFFTILLR